METINQIDIDITEDVFGPFYQYLIDPNVVNVDYSAGSLWVDDLTKGVFNVSSDDITQLFLNRFCNKMCNMTNQSFNAEHPTLEAEAPYLRITIVHECASMYGRTIVIRKTKASLRHTISSMLYTKYCEPQVLSFLINACIAGLNGIYGGKIGMGKTELLKFFLQFIPKNQKTVILEDTREAYYDQINPGAYFNDFRITEKFGYDKAIRTVLRSNAERLYLIEARGREITSILEAWSTGTAGTTTIHLDDVHKLSSRVVSMAGDGADADRIKRLLYDAIDFAIVISRHKLSEEDEKNIPKEQRVYSYRYIDQLYVYDNSDSALRTYPIVENGRLVSSDIDLPDSILRKMERAGIENPFYNPLVYNPGGTNEKRQENIETA